MRKEFDGRVTEFVWDGNDLVHERVTDANGEKAPLVTWLFEPGMFSPVAKVEGRRRYSVVSDHLGVPRALMTEAGKIAWQAQLDVYGVPRESSPVGDAAAGETERTGNPWRFPGQYEDPETGLFYNRFRYYDPEIGRYISEDPIGLAGGAALFGYATDPAQWIDPWGLTARGCAGVVKGLGKETGEKWLRGSHGNAGWIPSEIANKLRGRQFASFDSFRDSFWKEVAANPKYANQFAAQNIARMEQGLAPKAASTQWAGKMGSYQIHHITPIHQGGDVYDIDNMIVVTPRYHQEVLDPGYHYD
ncbi:MAG: RHS repeat-associated core domain-containing protein [Polyangiaceae bacterium]